MLNVLLYAIAFLSLSAFLELTRLVFPPFLSFGEAVDAASIQASLYVVMDISARQRIPISVDRTVAVLFGYSRPPVRSLRRVLAYAHLQPDRGDGGSGSLGGWRNGCLGEKARAWESTRAGVCCSRAQDEAL